ncbi:general substrate transporter [Hortaea werneckii]|nr:general substrate transporter [Hortaea werneckii]KAI7101356.1 general substrate transporter [Hortaea werneckii]KAI7210628.1 general substrate transporter [Hortaea werneckii]KAI7324962.1 general substrate transporter [Hortaea werneckii]KAI7378851.1 general substrate transporter [Hortaea werneckii]
MVMISSKPYFGLRGTALTAWLTVACATDMTLFGYDQGVFSGVIVSDDFLQLHGIAGKSELISITTAIYNIGCFLGAIVAAGYGDRWGRKLTIMIGTTIMAVGAILQTSSFSLAQMMVGRIVTGIGNGLNTSTAPVWQADSAKSSWRGILVVVECVMNIAGFSLVNWISTLHTLPDAVIDADEVADYGMSFAGGSVAWRVPLAIQFVFIVILYATVPWLPESPRWLMSQNREAEAAEITALIEDRDIDDPEVMLLVNDIKWAVDYERENAPTWRELFSGKTSNKGGTGTLQRMFLGIACFAMQQGTGINVTSYYLPTLLIESVNLDTETSRLLTACNSVQYLFFTALALLFVERLGRRRMLITGAAGMAVSFVLIAALLSQSETASNDAEREVWASASIAFFFTFFSFFGFGWMGCSWLYPTEIVSLTMRAKATGLGVATNWIVNFMVVLVTPIGIDNIGWKFYIIWAVLNALFVPIVYLFYPETANRRLEDIDRYFAEGKHVFVCFDKEATSSKRPERFEVETAEELQKVKPGKMLEKREQDVFHAEN